MPSATAVPVHMGLPGVVPVSMPLPPGTMQVIVPVDQATSTVQAQIAAQAAQAQAAAHAAMQAAAQAQVAAQAQAQLVTQAQAQLAAQAQAQATAQAGTQPTAAHANATSVDTVAVHGVEIRASSMPIASSQS